MSRDCIQQTPGFLGLCNITHSDQSEEDQVVTEAGGPEGLALEKQTKSDRTSLGGFLLPFVNQLRFLPTPPERQLNVFVIQCLFSNLEGVRFSIRVNQRPFYG